MIVGDAIRLIEADGWQLMSIKGSHRQEIQNGKVHDNH